MMTSIDFHDEFGVERGKVDNEFSNWHLPTELESFEPSISKA